MKTAKRQTAWWVPAGLIMATVGFWGLSSAARDSGGSGKIAPEKVAEYVHAVIEADRTDNLAAHYLGDPELYWRLCDANNAMLPEELTDTVGRKLRIVLPEGVPGAGARSDV